MYTECETCGETVEAEITHNGVCMVGHYVHCGWGHQCAPEDLRDEPDKPRSATEIFGALEGSYE